VSLVPLDIAGWFRLVKPFSLASGNAGPPAGKHTLLDPFFFFAALSSYEDHFPPWPNLLFAPVALPPPTKPSPDTGWSRVLSSCSRDSLAGDPLPSPCFRTTPLFTIVPPVFRPRPPWIAFLRAPHEKTSPTPPPCFSFTFQCATTPRALLSPTPFLPRTRTRRLGFLPPEPPSSL